MNHLDYLNSLIEGQKVSEIPVQLVELRLLRTLVENQPSPKKELQDDADRYKFITDRDNILSCFSECYNRWDGCDGKVGFDSAVDKLRK